MFILIACLSIIIPTGKSQSITPSNVIINQLANYKVQATDTTTTIAAGSVILINFPKQFSPYQFQINKPYTGRDVGDFCPNGCGLVSIDCSGQTIILNGFYPVAGTPRFTYTIFNIRNPLYKIRTSNFTIEFRSADYVNTQYKINITGRDYFA
jgi:hypothetical protein